MKVRAGEGLCPSGRGRIYGDFFQIPAMPQRLRQLTYTDLRFVVMLPLVLAACDTGDPQADVAFLEFQEASTYVRTFGVEGEPTAFVDTLDVSVKESDRVLNGESGLTEVRATSRVIGQEERAWYRATRTTLELVGHQCPGLGIAPSARRAGGSTSLVQPTLVASATARTSCTVPTVRDEPFVMYRLPLRGGASWQSTPYPFRTERRVTGTERVTVGAGTFSTFVIQTLVYADAQTPTPLMWTDYVSEEQGLVLRVMSVEQDRTNEQGEIIGRFRSVERIERIR